MDDVLACCILSLAVKKAIHAVHLAMLIDAVSDGLSCLEAIHAWHAIVKKDQVVHFALALPDRL